MSEPKPCPFCGHVGLDFREGSTFRWLVAECAGCGASTGETRIQTLGDGTKEEWRATGQQDAIEVWNRRAAVQAAQPEPMSAPTAPAQAEPVHWRALLDPAQRPQKLQTRHHVVGFTSYKACEEFVASELDMNGWRYTIEPLYNRPALATPPTAASDATPPATAAGPSDAERYQWLRENNAYSIHDRLFADCPMNKFNDAMLDAAIDAAIRATKGGKL